ncbi:MAG: cobalamin-dependent protein [Gemmatimonadota bacterium]|nr:MAG: cobalamin-dependent protein [Gemmatimonadota bacterium]
MQPKVDPRVRSLGKLEPLALEILAGALSHHEVRLFDHRFEANLAREVSEWRPDVVGVTALTVEYGCAVDAIREVRATRPDVRIVVGGTHATMMPADFALPEVDAVVLGLGHDTFRELLDAHASGKDPSAVRGLALPEKGGLRFTDERPPAESFDAIPNPDRSVTRRYRRRYRATFSLDPEGEATVITSLGCPGRCAFCSSWQQNKGRYLERDPESVVEEILAAPGRRLVLADDNSLHNIERAWRIVELLRRSKTRKRVRTFVRADTIAANPDLMRALREVGFGTFIVGYEAVTDARLREYHKGNTMETNRAAIRVLREAGIENRAMFMVAQDFRREDFAELSRFIEQEKLRTPIFAVFTPVPGTPLYERSQNDLLTRDYAYFDYVHCVLPTRMDYLEFHDEFVKLYMHTYSIRRYLRDWAEEGVQLLKTGRWPATERKHVPLGLALFYGLAFRRYLAPLRRDYEAIARAHDRERT